MVVVQAGGCGIEFVEHLPDYYCLVPDLPGHGKSQNVSFSIQETVDQLNTLLDEKAVGRETYLVGLSLGAQVGLSMLAQYPQRFTKAVLSGLLAIPMSGMMWLMDWSARLYIPFRNIPWLVHANMKSYGIPAEYFPQFAEDTRLLTSEGFRDIMKANGGFTKPADLAKVQAPTLILVGQKELHAIYQSTRRVIKDFPMAEAFVVAGAIHNWALQKPELFAETLRAWIEGLTLPPQLEPLATQKPQEL